MNDMRKFIGVVSEDERIDELKPMSGIGKMATNTKAAFGNQKAQREQASRDAAETIYAKWKKESVIGGLDPTPALLTRWLEKHGVNATIIQAAFEGIGINNVEQYLRNPPKENGEAEIGVEDPTQDEIPQDEIS